MTTTSTMTKTQLLIGGSLARRLRSAQRTKIAIPATGAKIADVADATRDDVDAAVEAARRAFDAGKWPTMAASRRAKIIYKLAQLIAERSADLALYEVRDNGKTIATAKGELSAIVDTLRVLCRRGDEELRRNAAAAASDLSRQHRARTGRRGRCDRSVELPAAARLLEGSAGARRRAARSYSSLRP